VFLLELRVSLKVSEIIQSLKTESRAEAIPLALRLAASVTVTFNELKTANIACISHLEVIRLALPVLFQVNLLFHQQYLLQQRWQVKSKPITHIKKSVN